MQNRRFLFRVDAGGETGLGHFYRSWHLAHELKDRGHIVEFIHRPSDFWNQLTSFGFRHISFESDDENKETLDCLLRGDFDTFYVDGILDFEEDSFYEIKKLVKVVFYQNISSFRFLADIFILPSIHQDADFFDVFNAGTKVFRGLEYFMFNQNILSLRVKDFDSSKKIDQVAIISGGSDPENVLFRLYQLIDHKRFRPIGFTYFFGTDYMHADSIPVNYPSNVRFESYDVKEIMRHDLLLSAFGVSTYEFMYLGMPVLSFGHQPSNSLASQILAGKTGGVFHLGYIKEMETSLLNDQLSTFIDRGELRQNLLKKSKTLLDLNGVQRVVNILENE